MSRSDGKRPDVLTLIPRQAGKPLTWDVTVVCPYIRTAAQDAGAVAELAAARKTAKYTALESRYIIISANCGGNARPD